MKKPYLTYGSFGKQKFRIYEKIKKLHING